MTGNLGTKTPTADAGYARGWLDPFARAQAHEISRPVVSPDGWQQRTQPLQVALVADLHLGSHSDDVERFEHIVEEINAWQPDLVLALGDFMHSRIVMGRQIDPEITARILGEARPRLGTFAVLGNHDWRYDGSAVRRALETHGIAVLENSVQRIADTSGEFWIAGLADDKTRTPEVEKTLRSVPQNAPTLIMAHDPATFGDVPAGPYLTVSGHTHGGQVCLPFIGALINSSRAPLKWTSGHIVENGKHLYVCRGLGTSLVPLRLNCPPELCFMTIGP